VGQVGRTLLVVAATVLAATVGAQERPLPNRQQFFDTTRANLERSQARQASYAYRERRRELHTNPFGHLLSQLPQCDALLPTFAHCGGSPQAR